MLARSFLKSFILSSVMLGLTSGAMAQSYPTKPINVIVPYPAGGVADFVARFMTKEMTNTLKQSLLIENVVGVGGALGTAKVLAATPDGYSLVLSDPASTILTPLANSNAKYKPEDLKTVAMLGQADIMLVTRKELGVNNVAELIALAQKNSAKPLSYCTAGIGSIYHLMSEKFNATAGVKALHLPYNGFPQCITNMVGQIVDFAFLPIAGPFPGFVDSGGLKILAVASSKPNTRFPKAPLVKASKGFENFVFTAWAGMHVSQKVPDDAVLALNKSAMAAMETAEVKQRFAESGSIIFDAMSPSQAHAFYLREAANYQAIAKSINLQQQ